MASKSDLIDAIIYGTLIITNILCKAKKTQFNSNNTINIYMMIIRNPTNY